MTTLPLIAARLLAAATAALLLAGCAGSSDDPGANTPDPAPTDASEPTESPATDGEEPQELTGSRWRLVSAVDSLPADGPALQIPRKVRATLTFTSPDLVTFTTGCNTGGATLQRSADSLTFLIVDRSTKSCSGQAAAIETLVLETLDGEAVYEVSADTLTLRAGETGLTYERTA